MKEKQVSDVDAAAEALGLALLGEKMYRLEEANALGYFSVAQMCAKVGSRDAIREKIKVLEKAGKIESVRLRAGANAKAYRLKR